MDYRHKCFHLDIVAYSLVFFQEGLNNTESVAYQIIMSQL
jgi:hypothetical protein